MVKKTIHQKTIHQKTSRRRKNHKSRKSRKSRKNHKSSKNHKNHKNQIEDQYGKSKIPRKLQADPIIDVEFSGNKSLGTRATKGNVDFHYQKYANMNNYFDILHLTNLSTEVSYIELICLDNKIVPLYTKKFKKSNEQFTMFIINIKTPEGHHANVLLVNNHNRTLEYFEPHGHREDKNSGFSGVIGLYMKKLKVLKQIFKEILPEYVFINVVDHTRKSSFQTRYDPDDNTGFCISWCILFVHYRCLNPFVLLHKLINHLSRTITTVKLLKYAGGVEEKIKDHDRNTCPSCNRKTRIQSKIKI